MNDCIHEFEVFTTFFISQIAQAKTNMRLKAMEDDSCADMQALQCPN